MYLRAAIQNRPISVLSIVLLGIFGTQHLTCTELLFAPTYKHLHGAQCFGLTMLSKRCLGLTRTRSNNSGTLDILLII
jgi:hypothetical protein